MVSHTFLNDSLYNQVKKDESSQQINDLNQLLQDGEAFYEYNLNGNRILKKGATETHYTYDAQDRLLSVITDTEKCVYSYDESNRRLSKTFFNKDDTSWKKEKEIRFFYQGDYEIGSVNEQGELQELRILGKGRQGDIGSTISIELKDNPLPPCMTTWDT